MIEPADFSYVPAGNGRCGMSFSDPHLRSLGIDIRAMARGGTLAQTSHPAMPAQILTLTRHWLKLGGRGAPQWSQFELLDVAEVAPYLTIAECLAEHTFHFTFIGSAVSALLGEDVRDRTISLISPMLGEIDWYRRCKPVSDTADLQVLTGKTNPPYTAPVEFTAADFPFMTDSDGAVSHIIGVTVPRVN